MCYRIVFALFYFVFGDNFQVLAPKVIFEGAIKRNFFFLRYKFRGHIFGMLMHGGVYFRNFMVYVIKCLRIKNR